MAFNLKVEHINGKGPKSQMQDFGCFGKTADAQFLWVIVCDGIGGERGGEHAAKTTVKFLHTYIKKYLLNVDQLKSTDFFKDGIRQVQKKFAEFIEKESSLRLMGCTLCITIFTENKAFVFWSGDARFYQFRNGNCIVDTIPHNWSFDLYRKGVLSLEEARLSETSWLTGSINHYTAEIRVDVEVFTLEKNDRILICTDGVWALFEHPDLIKLMATPSLKNSAAHLKRILKEHANDNYYCFLVDCP